MSVVTNPPATPVRIALPVLSQPVKSELKAEWWVVPIKWIALIVFIAIPIVSVLLPAVAGRVVWTVVVAALPLFIVLIGYHRWRNICPLAFFAKLPAMMHRAGRRRAPQRLEAIYYYVAFAIFFASLWLRLNAINGDGPALALFFVAISLMALAVGASYTGKTWCNYLCPLSFIEKIYTEPHGLRETTNSQCTKCTACKNSCPDISEENGYWKEIGLKPKRFVYLAFPGLVFGFYFYYFLQAGNWDYYFGGSWTNEPDLWRVAFFPGFDHKTAGFFFLPQLPRAWASLATLGLCALASVAIFSQLEVVIGNWLRRGGAAADVARARHMTLSLAAFVAFVTFYTFAGAPTLRRLPWGFAHLFLVVVVLTATLFLIRRLHRTQTDFAEETLARNIIKRWQWPDTQPPRDLREAFLIHQMRTQEKARDATQILNIYRQAVEEAVADGFVTTDEVQMLQSLRNQLQINDTDHENVMLALAEEESALLRNPLQHLGSEKRLQLESYARALTVYLERPHATEGDLDEGSIKRLRGEYRVTEAEHEAVLKRLMGDPEDLARQLAHDVGRIENAALAIQALERNSSPPKEFLGYLLRRSRARAIERLLLGLSYTDVEEGLTQRMGEWLASETTALRVSAWEELRAQVAPHIAERITAGLGDHLSQESPLRLEDVLIELAGSRDARVRAVALLALNEMGAAGPDLLQRKSRDEDEIVRETAAGLLARTQSKSAGGETTELLLTVEKMIALRSAGVFQQLPPESLSKLAHAASPKTFAAGSALCHEGEEGNEVFILLSGDVKLFRHEGAVRKFIGSEQAGWLIGEMAVLDPAPRSATVIAGDGGVRVLRLDGVAFRQALHQSSSIASGVIQMLARRLRKAKV